MRDERLDIDYIDILIHNDIHMVIFQRLGQTKSAVQLYLFGAHQMRGHSMVDLSSDYDYGYVSKFPPPPTPSPKKTVLASIFSIENHVMVMKIALKQGFLAVLASFSHLFAMKWP